jgi:hypothetical protein
MAATSFPCLIPETLYPQEISDLMFQPLFVVGAVPVSNGCPSAILMSARKTKCEHDFANTQTRPPLGSPIERRDKKEKGKQQHNKHPDLPKHPTETEKQEVIPLMSPFQRLCPDGAHQHPTHRSHRTTTKNLVS